MYVCVSVCLSLFVSVSVCLCLRLSLSVCSVSLCPSPSLWQQDEQQSVTLTGDGSGAGGAVDGGDVVGQGPRTLVHTALNTRAAQVGQRQEALGALLTTQLGGGVKGAVLDRSEMYRAGRQGVNGGWGWTDAWVGRLMHGWLGGWIDVEKTVIILQGAILLWSWWARKLMNI